MRDKFYYASKETIYDKSPQTFRNISRARRLLKSILILSVKLNAGERERTREGKKEIESWKIEKVGLTMLRFVGAV